MPAADATLDRVVRRLGFDRPPAPTTDGLAALYRAWCRRVPFDNVRKRLTLERGAPGPLPGGTADDFFAAWLADGTGGTCWPSSNALYELLVACGFDARRIAASMYDGGDRNHGSVVVRVDGGEWLVDSSMLTDIVLPLRPGERFEREDPVHPVVVDPSAAGWLVHFGHTMARTTLPCRLLDDPVDHAFYLARYEVSRTLSPFNALLYARRNAAEGLVSFHGATRWWKTADAITDQVLEPDALRTSLVTDLGLSAAIVADLLAIDAPAG